MMKILDSIPLSVIVILCLTLGLAPFSPQPHVWEKLKMLLDGNLSSPIDIFDLVMHGFPFILLIFKLALVGRGVKD